MNEDQQCAAGSVSILPVYQKRSRASQQRLLDAAQREFARVGFNRATVSDLVREANCSVGSFYRRFKDKEALFYSLQQDVFGQSLRDIDKFFSNPKRHKLSLKSLLSELVIATYHAIAKSAGYFRAFIELTHSDARVWSRMTDLEAFQADRLATMVVQRGHFAAASPELIERAHLATRTVNGFIIMHVLYHPEGFSPLEPMVVEQLARIFLVGMELPPAAYEVAPPADRTR